MNRLAKQEAELADTKARALADLPGLTLDEKRAHLRVLDLLEELDALLARAERAERDRKILARLARAWNLRDQREDEHDATSIASDGTAQPLEEARASLSEAWRSAAGALERAGGAA